MWSSLEIVYFITKLAPTNQIAWVSEPTRPHCGHGMAEATIAIWSIRLNPTPVHLRFVVEEV
jgi:hypothetical protein